MNPARLLCWLRGIWYTIKTSNVFDFTSVDGHSYEPVSDTGYFECQTCGKLMQLYQHVTLGVCGKHGQYRVPGGDGCPKCPPQRTADE